MRTDPETFGKSFVVGVTIAASVLWSLPTYGDDLGQAQQEIRGGKVILGAAGIVELEIYDPAGQDGTCTGSLISPNAVITAAHCLERVGAVPAVAGNGKMNVYYYDPATGRRKVFDGIAAWRILPEYTGVSLGSAVGSISDIGIIITPSVFTDTGYDDYLRIYDDTDGALDTWLTAYGAGIYSYSGNEDENIRTAKFEVEDVNSTFDYIVVDTRKSVGICLGDSGGPLIYTAHLDGHEVPTIAGVASGFEYHPELLLGEGRKCTNNDLGIDDAVYSQTTWKKLESMMAAARISCQRISSGELSYRRCFDLPFIEDIEWEGMDRDLAVAIAAAAIF